MSELEIDKAIVVLGFGQDMISVRVPSVPSPIASEPLCLDFKAPQDTGVEYVRKHLRLEPEVINARNPRPKFGKPK